MLVGRRVCAVVAITAWSSVQFPLQCTSAVDPTAEPGSVVRAAWHKDSLQASMPDTAWDRNWDHYGTKEQAGTGTRHIVLIRHGQYVTNDPKLTPGVDTELDFRLNDPLRPLTALGKEQAHTTGKHLAKFLEKTAMAKPGTALAVYASDMTRARQTGEIIHSHLRKLRAPGVTPPPVLHKFSDEVPLLMDSMLREGAPCTPEGYDGPWCPGDNEFHEEAARIEAAFRKHLHRAPAAQQHDSVDVIVCHGNVIRYFVLRAMQLPPGAWLRLSLYNTSITRLSIGPTGKVSVKCIGDVSALAPKDVTYH